MPVSRFGSVIWKWQEHLRNLKRKEWQGPTITSHSSRLRHEGFTWDAQRYSCDLIPPNEESWAKVLLVMKQVFSSLSQRRAKLATLSLSCFAQWRQLLSSVPVVQEKGRPHLIGSLKCKPRLRAWAASSCWAGSSGWNRRCSPFLHSPRLCSELFSAPYKDIGYGKHFKSRNKVKKANLLQIASCIH